VTAPSSEATRQAELDQATIVAWSRRTRAACGLGPKIEDPTTLARIVTLALGAGLPNDSPDRNGGADST
jgi:hypothetical protein